MDSSRLTLLSGGPATMVVINVTHRTTLGRRLCVAVFRRLCPVSEASTCVGRGQWCCPEARVGKTRGYLPGYSILPLILSETGRKSRPFTSLGDTSQAPRQRVRVPVSRDGRVWLRGRRLLPANVGRCQARPRCCAANVYGRCGELDCRPAGY